jgi:competence protein ComEC
VKGWNVKQPLLPVVLWFVAGILLADRVPFQPAGLFGLALAVASLAIFWGRSRPVLLAALIFLAGAVDLTRQTAVISPIDLRSLFGEQDAIVTLRGRLSSTPSLRISDYQGQSTTRAHVEIQVIGVKPLDQPWQPALGRVAASAPEAVAGKLFAGQTVEVFGVLRRPRGPQAEGLFDYREYLRRQQIHFQLQTRFPDDWNIVDSPARAPLADRFRAWGRQTLALGLPGEDESLRLEWALTLGWKTALTDEVAEPFIRASTYHIFAVDGLRMAILFGIFFALSRALNLSRPASGLVLLPLLWFYTALTGWPASAIRATVMLTVVVLGWSLKRPADLLNSLFAAALGILLWQPQQLFQAGFQLSFLVVLSILLVLPPLERLGQWLLLPDPLLPPGLLPRWRKILGGPLRFLMDIFLVSLAAWLGSIPLAACYFHIFTPVSAFANLLAVPLCALVLTANIGSLLLAAWLPAGAVLFNHAGWFLMECIRVTSAWFASWPGAYAYVPAPGWFAIGLYYFALLGLMTGWLFRPGWRGLKMSALAALFAVWGVLCWREHSASRLTVLPLDGGSAILCDRPGHRDDLLVDCGPEAEAKSVLTPFLRSQGEGHLPRLLLTHGEARFVGGAETIRQTFSVNQIAISPVRFRSPVYQRILEHFTNDMTISRGDLIAGWTVLHPAADDHFPLADDNALVLRADFSGVRVLLLSDLGRAGQDALLARNPDLHADILVAGQPAKGEALCEALLNVVRPRVIVITGPGRYGAGREFSGRLARRGVPVIYADEAGAVTVSLRAGRWEIRAMDGTRLGG